MRKFGLLVAVLTLVAAPAVGGLYVQPPHTPGATGGNGLSGFQGTLDGGTTVFDREIADDFTVPSPGWYVDQVVSQWIPFDNLTTIPITAVDVIFYNKVGTLPGTVFATATVTGFSVVGGGPLYFTRNMRTVTVDISRVELYPGDYFVFIQPRVNHNWFWLTYTPNLPLPFDAAASRRGPDAVGTDTTWNTAWMNTGPGHPVWTTRFDMAFALVGEVVPEPASLLLIGVGLLGVLRRR